MDLLTLLTVTTTCPSEHAVELVFASPGVVGKYHPRCALEVYSKLHDGAIVGARHVKLSEDCNACNRCLCCVRGPS